MCPWGVTHPLIWEATEMPSPKPPVKSWYKSKTIIVNTLTAGIAVITALQGQQIVAEHPQLAAGLVVAISIANIALRAVTFLPLE
jgi:hypothetical protein